MDFRYIRYAFILWMKLSLCNIILVHQKYHSIFFKKKLFVADFSFYYDYVSFQCLCKTTVVWLYAIVQNFIQFNFELDKNFWKDPENISFPLYLADLKWFSVVIQKSNWKLEWKLRFVKLFNKSTIENLQDHLDWLYIFS